MKPFMWSGKMELYPGSDSIYEPWDVYPRLWEYITTDFKYLGYNPTVKAAMKKYAGLTAQEFSFALDTSQLPWLYVTDESSFGDKAGWNAQVIGSDEIWLEEEYVKHLEDGHDCTTFTRSGQEVQLIGVFLLVTLVVWGIKRQGNLKTSGLGEINGMCKAVYGWDYKSLGARRHYRTTPLAMIPTTAAANPASAPVGASAESAPASGRRHRLRAGRRG